MVKKIVVLLACVAVAAAARAQKVEEAGGEQIRTQKIKASNKITRRQRFDRGLAFDTKTPSMPKGMWIAGVNVSYSQHNSDDYRIFIVNDLSSKGNALNISPMVHYVFANNQSIGIRFAYKRSWLQLDELSFNLTPELNSMLFGENEVRYNYQNHTYMGYLTYRYYVGIGQSKRLLIFNEVQAGFGGGQQRELSGWNDDKTDYKTGTYQKSFNFRLGFAPGATVFITNAMAVEVQIGLLGYEFRKLKQEGTNLVSSSYTSSSISSKFDFLSIAFGTTFYL